jgi:hypothetical protein
MWEIEKSCPNKAEIAMTDRALRLQKEAVRGFSGRIGSPCGASRWPRRKLFLTNAGRDIGQLRVPSKYLRQEVKSNATEPKGQV